MLSSSCFFVIRHAFVFSSVLFCSNQSHSCCHSPSSAQGVNLATDHLCLVSNKDVPLHIPIMFDALAETRKELIETRKELVEMGRQNDAIQEENKKLRKESHCSN
ncbi:unnamed protein product [Heligmosomoides polygyrus]|uniref:Uncharacterized protein n=1 Tax=Heligmosomoides polygyrus TaxID=6339 RepID=A0A183FQE6_HELPZ|nr:unnamed protein product [Heligmosomoides polygyrus]